MGVYKFVKIIFVNFSFNYLLLINISFKLVKKLSKDALGSNKVDKLDDLTKCELVQLYLKNFLFHTSKFSFAMTFMLTYYLKHNIFEFHCQDRHLQKHDLNKNILKLKLTKITILCDSCFYVPKKQD